MSTLIADRTSVEASCARGARIGYLVPEFPGQTHIFFLRDIDRLAALGARAVIISTRRPGIATCKHDRLNSLAESAVYLFPPHLGKALVTLAGRPRGLLRVLGLWLEISRGPRDALKNLAAMICGAELVRVAMRESLSHVHLQSCGNAALIAAFSRRLGGPTYSLTLLNPLSTFGPHQVQKWRDASFGIVITRRLLDEVRRTLGSALPNRIEVAPVGVDLEKFRRDEGETYQPWSGKGPFRLFSCGRLNPCKGHDDLIRAVGLLRDRGTNVTLEIAGTIDHRESSYGEELEALIKTLDLRDRVRLLGSLSEDQIAEHLKVAHAFALLSLEEPLGVALMEAMALGVPVVATRAGGVPELVEDRSSGILVSPRNPGDAASAFLTLMNDPSLTCSLGAEGRRTVEAGFGAEVGARTLLDAVVALGVAHGTQPQV